MQTLYVHYDSDLKKYVGSYSLLIPNSKPLIYMQSDNLTDAVNEGFAAGNVKRVVCIDAESFVEYTK
jgi:hypothetical protein